MPATKFAADAASLPPSAGSWSARYHRHERAMAVNGGAIARNLASVVALEAFRIPLGAASACGLGNLQMATKTTKTVTVDWKIDVAAIARALAVIIFLLA